MKSAFFLFAILAALVTSAAESYMYSRDAKTIVSDPMALPSCGVRLDTGTYVLGLHGASIETRAACGWYLCVSTNVAPDGMAEASATWEIVGTEAVRRASYAVPAPTPETNHTLSKYRLLCELKSAGALGAFGQWLAADAERKLLWDAAVTLDSTNAMVREASATLPALLGVTASSVSNMLDRSRVE